MKYFIFSKLNKNHFLFLTYFFISIGLEIVNKYVVSGKDIIFELNRFYIYTLSHFLSIIPLIIIKIRTRGIKRNQSYKNIALYNINFIYTDFKKKKCKRIIKYSIIVSIFTFFALYLNVIFDIIIKIIKIDVKEQRINSNILINIISKYALSIIILHLKIYKHHYLSLAIDLLCLIILIIYDIYLIKDTKLI